RGIAGGGDTETAEFDAPGTSSIETAPMGGRTTVATKMAGGVATAGRTSPACSLAAETTARATNDARQAAIATGNIVRRPDAWRGGGKAESISGATSAASLLSHPNIVQ